MRHMSKLVEFDKVAFSYLGQFLPEDVFAIFVSEILDDLHVNIESFSKINKDVSVLLTIGSFKFSHNQLESKRLVFSKEISNLLSHIAALSSLREPIDGFLSIVNIEDHISEEQEVDNEITQNRLAIIDEIFDSAKKSYDAYEAIIIGYPKLIAVVNDNIKITFANNNFYCSGKRITYLKSSFRTSVAKVLWEHRKSNIDGLTGKPLSKTQILKQAGTLKRKNASQNFDSFLNFLNSKQPKIKVNNISGNYILDSDI